MTIEHRRRLLAGTAGVVLASGMVAGHVAYLARGDDATGPLLVVNHLFDLTIVLGMLALASAVGRLALRKAGVRLEQPLEALTFGVAIGMGIIAAGILLLGLMRAMYTPVLMAWLGALAFAARRELADLGRLLRSAAGSLRRQAGEEAIAAGVALTVLCVVAVFLVVMALAPPVDWDSLMYHLHVPAQFLQHHRIFLPPDNLHAALVGLPHMLYVVFLALGSPAGPSLLSAALAVLLGLAVVSFGMRFFGRLSTMLSVTILWGTTTILLVAMTARLDVTLALYLFLAHHALLVALSSTSRPHLYLAAVLLGLAVGVKYHALPYILAVAPLVLWITWTHTRHIGRLVRPLAVFSLLGVAAALPWLIKNWILLGAPFHPLLAPLSLEPWLVPLFGSAVVPADVDLSAFQALTQSRATFNLWDAFFAPERLTIEPEGVFYRLSVALLALPLWFVFVKNRTLSWLVVPAVGYVIILIVPFPTTNLRYLIPAVTPLTIAVAHMAVSTSRRFLSESGARMLLLGLAALVLLPAVRMMHGWLVGTKAMGHLAGMTSAAEYRANRVTYQLIGPVVRVANERLTRDDRILMLFEARAFYFEPSVTQDVRVANWPLLADKLRPGDCLQDSGVTHVLLGTGALGYYINRGLDPAVARWEAFQQFAGRCLVPIHESTGFVLYEVRREISSSN
jgi:hypothetical protein